MKQIFKKVRIHYCPICKTGYRTFTEAYICHKKCIELEKIKEKQNETITNKT